MSNMDNSSNSPAAPAILLHQPTNSTTTSTDTDGSDSMGKKSFFGSVRDKIRGRSTSPRSSGKTPSSRSSHKGDSPRSTHGRESPRPTSPASSSAYQGSSSHAATSRSRSAAARAPVSNNDAPPSYNEAMGTHTLRAGSSAVRTSSPAPSLASLSTPEDPYAFLSTFDTAFVIDDSGSMRGRSWREVREALRSITPICAAHDSDGLDIYFLNHKSPLDADTKTGKAAGGYRGFKNPGAIENLFESVQPYGGTPTGTRLHNILKPYIQLVEAKRDNIESVKPVNLIVITDGVPSDDVESVLISAAKRLDRVDAPPYQLGVQFFQVGNEPGAREALTELDDCLHELVEGGVRDIVDTVTWSGRSGQVQTLTADGILKVVLGAVVKRLDRRRQT